MYDAEIIWKGWGVYDRKRDLVSSSLMAQIDRVKNCETNYRTGLTARDPGTIEGKLLWRFTGVIWMSENGGRVNEIA